MRILKYAFIIAFILCSCADSGLFKDKNKETPNEATTNFYKYLMWKDYDGAGFYVNPIKKPLFDEMVLKNEKDLNITSYVIKEIILLDDEPTECIIKVLLRYYKYPSVSEKTIMVENKWIKQNKTWVIDSDFEESIYN